MSQTEGEYFFSIEVKEHVVLMPWYIGNIKMGIQEKLNPRILEYSPKLQGILVSYSDVTILQSAGAIHEDSPQVHFDIKYSACMFQPPIGTVFNAIVNKVGDDYFTCLAHGCFSVLVSLGIGESNYSTAYSDITEGQEVCVQITNLPVVGDHVTLIGELYVEKLKKAAKKRARETDSAVKKSSKRHRKDKSLLDVNGDVSSEIAGSTDSDNTVLNTCILNDTKSVRLRRRASKCETVVKLPQKREKKKRKTCEVLN